MVHDGIGICFFAAGEFFKAEADRAEAVFDGWAFEWSSPALAEFRGVPHRLAIELRDRGVLGFVERGDFSLASPTPKHAHGELPSGEGSGDAISVLIRSAAGVKLQASPLRLLA